jgi:hypothetical protein
MTLTNGAQVPYLSSTIFPSVSRITKIRSDVFFQGFSETSEDFQDQVNDTVEIWRIQEISPMRKKGNNITRKLLLSRDKPGIQEGIRNKKGARYKRSAQ